MIIIKVLAYRSNKIFITAPILVPLCFFIIWMSIGGGFGLGYRIRIHMLLMSFTIMISQLAGFIERFFIPKVIIEYDDFGLYIYKYKRRDPILLHYEQIWGCRAHINEGAEDIPFNFDPFSGQEYSYENTAIRTTQFVGSLKFNTPHSVINVHGIKDVKAVERKLAAMRYDFKEDYEEWLNYNIEQSKRNEELEELAKHNINT